MTNYVLKYRGIYLEKMLSFFHNFVSRKGLRDGERIYRQNEKTEAP